MPIQHAYLVEPGSTDRESRMTRHARTSTARDIVDLTAMLPWWVGVVLAIASYLPLSAVARRSVEVTSADILTSGVAMSVVVKGLASVGQYVLPVLFLAGAAASAVGRHRRRRLLDSASDSAGAISGMRWQEFELLVGEAFRRQGYQVTESGGGGADGGVDLVLSRRSLGGTEKTLVQCKHWRANKVGVTVVRELYGVMAAKGAAAGIVVTSGRFTNEAHAFADGRNLRLVDASTLVDLIRSGREGLQSHKIPASADALEKAPARTATDTASRLEFPSCPVCEKAMVQRIAKRGLQAGNRFWGCAAYPACRGTRVIDER